MKIIYYELYYEVIIIEEFSIKNMIWQHINDSKQIDQIYNVHFIQKKTATASILIYIILQKLINNHKLLKKFVTNRNKLFMSKFWKMFTAKFRIKWKILTAYYL